MNPIGLAIAADPLKHPAPPGHPEWHGRLAPAIAALESATYQAVTQSLSSEDYDLSLLGRVHSDGLDF